MQVLMDRFFDTDTAPLVVELAKEIRAAIRLSVDNFEDEGATIDDVRYIEHALGIRDGKVQKYHKGKMTVLFALGSMMVIRNDIISLMLNSFTGMVTRTDLWRGIERSINRKYRDFFATYATGAIFQSYNAAQLSFARKYDYKKFRYVGGIIEESREFCVERAGHEFFREDGEAWNKMDWRGKIQGVDFFIQCGGYNCLHHIHWIKDEEEE